MRRDGWGAPHTKLRAAGGTLDWSEWAMHRTVTAHMLWSPCKVCPWMHLIICPKCCTHVYMEMLVRHSLV